MKKIFLRLCASALACILTLQVYGQEKFDEQLVAINNLTPYQAIQKLEQYQQGHPKFAATYYHLGKANEALISNIHPILKYEYLQRVLYNTKVYYGNCMHYAKESTLKKEHFEGIPTNSKSIEIQDITHFAGEKLKQVKETESLVNNLYDSYSQMVERYGVCRHLFTEFCELYPSEKQAHLRLQTQDVALLDNLAELFDSLQLDIKTFENALQKYPIDGYQPRFEYSEIRLYRLDGLTHTNFLQPTIPLWNYGAFVEQFMQKQNHDYAMYYQTIQEEFQQIEDAVNKIKIGQKTHVKTNIILSNYINKMDYESFMVPLTHIQQMCADMINCHTNGLLATNDSTLEQEYIELALNSLYDKHLNKKASKNLITTLQSRLNKTEIEKYKKVLLIYADTTTTAIEQLAQNRLLIADSIYNEICKDFYQDIDTTIQKFEQYKDLLNDIVIHVNQLPVGNAEVVAVLPATEGYLAVYADGLFVVLNAQLEAIRRFEYQHYAPIKTAYKIRGNNIAIITPSQIYFIDNQGKEI